MNMRGFRIACLFSAIVATVADLAFSQQLFVRTHATNASGQVSRADLIVADLATQAFSPPLFSLSEPGETASGGVYTGASYVWALHTAGTNRLIELPLRQSDRTETREYTVDGRIVKIAIARLAGSRYHVAAATDTRDRTGRLLIFSATESGFVLDREPVEALLPGRPIDLIHFASQAAWAVLCETPQGAVIALISTAGRGRNTVVPVTLSRTIPRALVECGTKLLVIAEGYDLTRGDGLPVLTVRVMQETGRPPSEARIAGRLIGFVTRSDQESAWIVTEATVASGATASLTEPMAAGTVKQVISLPSASESFAAQWVTSDNSIVFACGRHVQHWSAGGELLAKREFPAPVSCLAPSADGIVIAEGNRIHRVSLVGLVLEKTVRFSSGRVASFAEAEMPLPGLGDRDYDLIFDPIDADPDSSTPTLAVPRFIHLRSAGNGGRERVISVSTANSRPGYRYRIDNPAEAFRLEPDRGTLPNTIDLRRDAGVWALRPPADREFSAEIGLYPENGDQLLDSARIRISVDPSPEVSTCVLVVSAKGLEKYGGLIDQLRSAPRFYSVSVEPNPDADRLDRYQVVILSLESALGGRISRVALERYAARGGGLFLFTPTNLLPRISEIREWLVPFRVEVRLADETFRTVREGCDWCQIWENAGLGRGLLASVEPPGHALFMPGRAAREGPITRAPFGLGRVVFAGSDGLLNAVETNQDVRRAVLESVRWLARTGADVQDSDGDGLADSVEDLNDNGRVDPGETDPSNADSDGDRLQDGEEDINGNGRVDPGETDPRHPDTDGDRIPDAADTYPVPAVPGNAASVTGRER